MSRFIGFVFATCLLAIGISARAQVTNPDWPKSLTLVTASPGGVYYIYGEELARILADRLGIVVNPSSTQGAINNMRLLDRNEAQLGLITMSTGNEGWNGIAAWTNGKQFRNIRALFSMYDNPVQALVW
jgi:uncharacterized protein